MSNNDGDEIQAARGRCAHRRDSGRAPRAGALPERIGYALRRAQLAVFQDFVQTMAELDVRPAQYSVLLLIGINPGVSQTALGRGAGHQAGQPRRDAQCARGARLRQATARRERSARPRAPFDGAGQGPARAAQRARRRPRAPPGRAPRHRRETPAAAPLGQADVAHKKIHHRDTEDTEGERSLRAKRSNPEGGLDCFVAALLAMTISSVRVLSVPSVSLW